MKIVFIIATAILARSALADDITTTTGTKYQNVTVTRVEPDGIVVTTDAGIEKIPFASLPKEIQTKYGYDPQRANAYAAHEAAAAQARYEAAEQIRSGQQKIMSDETAKSSTDQVQANAQKYRVLLFVIRKTEGGLLLKVGEDDQYVNAGPETKAKIRTLLPFKQLPEAPDRSFLRGYPQEGAVADGDIVVCLAVEDGIVTVGGATYHAFKWVPSE